MLLTLLYLLFRRMIGSERARADRELEIEVVVLGERHLDRILRRYAAD